MLPYLQAAAMRRHVRRASPCILRPALSGRARFRSSPMRVTL